MASNWLLGGGNTHPPPLESPQRPPQQTPQRPPQPTPQRSPWGPAMFATVESAVPPVQSINRNNRSTPRKRGLPEWIRTFVGLKRQQQEKVAETGGEQQFMMPPMTSDPTDSGDVCFLAESPFRILRAAESGNVAVFRSLYLAEPSRLAVRDGRGRTAAHQAAAKNNTNILHFIQNYNEDLNIRDYSGNTPLHVAIENEALDAVEFLLQTQVDTGVLNQKSQAPIHLATELNKVLVLKIFVKYKNQFNVDQRGEHGRTALHFAAIHDHDECAKVLIIELEAEWKLPCNNGYYPIHEAAKNASSRTMEVFLEWGESRGCTRESMISLNDNEGNVPLHLAIHGGDIKGVELCLRSGAKISKQQHDLSSPVHLACSQGALEILKLMFTMQPEEKEACFTSCDVQKMTPIHCAAMFDHAEIVRYLITEGSDINPLDRNKRSPLLLAAFNRGWKAVHVLILMGANMELKDINSKNVLHMVVMKGGRLRDIAADCKGRCEMSLENLLNEKDDTGCSPLHYASRAGYIRSLENLINFGACVNLKNNNMESPLHFAARYGRYSTVCRLLESERGSFIINESDGEGLTPLHIASREGHTRVVQLLLNRGALLHRDHNSRNPLHLASVSGYTQTIELLYSVHSHLLDQTDKDGNTPLHLATVNNKPTAVVLLLSIGCRLTYNKLDMSAIDYAIYHKYSEAALAMVTHEQRGNEVMTLHSSRHPCVTLALIAHMPRVFQAVQDRCITKAKSNIDSEDYFIRYNFSVLCPQLTEDEETENVPKAQNNPLPALNIKYSFKYYQRSKLETDTLKQALNNPKNRPEPLCVINEMVTHRRVELLAHPLSQKYMQMKWNSYGKYYHLANLMFYCIFLISIMVYSYYLMSNVISIPPNTANNSSKSDANETKPQINRTDNITIATIGFKEKNESTVVMYICTMSILVYIALCLIKEAYSVKEKQWHYLLDTSHFMSWILYMSSLLMVVPTIFGNYNLIQISAAAITVFLSWFELLLLLQRFDKVGIYVVMFLEILQTLIKVLMVFSLLIIAFGMAFYILLSKGHHLSFSSVQMSLMRTFAMMLGELDFVGTYVQPYYKPDVNIQLPFPMPTFFILGVFMVLMPILLMNLLIGLAVGDIESVRRNAQLKRLAMQVVLHTELEKKLPAFLLEKVDKNEVVDFPNKKKSKLGFLDLILRKWFCNISDEGIPDKVQETSEDYIITELEKQKRKLRDMSHLMEQQHNLMRLMVQKMEIKSEADDMDEGVSANDMRVGPRWNSAKIRNIMRMASTTHKGG